MYLNPANVYRSVFHKIFSWLAMNSLENAEETLPWFLIVIRKGIYNRLEEFRGYCLCWQCGGLHWRLTVSNIGIGNEYQMLLQKQSWIYQSFSKEKLNLKKKNWSSLTKQLFHLGCSSNERAHITSQCRKEKWLKQCLL